MRKEESPNAGLRTKRCAENKTGEPATAGSLLLELNLEF